MAVRAFGHVARFIRPAIHTNVVTAACEVDADPRARSRRHRLLRRHGSSDQAGRRRGDKSLGGVFAIRGRDDVKIVAGWVRHRVGIGRFRARVVRCGGHWGAFPKSRKVCGDQAATKLPTGCVVPSDTGRDCVSIRAAKDDRPRRVWERAIEVGAVESSRHGGYSTCCRARPGPNDTSTPDGNRCHRAVPFPA